MEKFNWRKIIKILFVYLCVSAWLIFTVRGAALFLMTSVEFSDIAKFIVDALNACIWTVVVTLYKVKK